MASYDDNFRSMQQEAINRVNEMHRRSRQMVRGNHTPHQENQHSSHQEPPHQTSRETSSNDSGFLRNLLGGLSGQEKNGSLSKLLSDMSIDEEKALIGLVIYILAKNGADVKLLLGLGYLLL